jgi:cytochrome c-type biogenesis protein CcmF
MTRSGVFNSVHSFTQSNIGPLLLAFLAAALLLSTALLALRLDALAAEGTLTAGLSRDAMFLVQNLLLVLFTFTVLLGTVFPLVIEAVQGRQMSVGRPYFDRMASPLGVALLFAMGVGPALPWARVTRDQALRLLIPPVAAGVALAVAGLALGATAPWTLAALFFGGYAAQVTLREMFLPVRQRMDAHGEGLVDALRLLQGRGRRRFGAYLAHAGAIVIVIAIAVSSTGQQSKEVLLRPGQSATLGAYELMLVGIDRVTEPQREALRARLDIRRDGRELGSLYPRMTFYSTQREPIGTPAVHTSLREDLYLSAHNIDQAGGTVGLLILVNPMVGWIWFATAVIALGGLMALVPARRPQPAAQPAVNIAPAGAP